MKKLIRRVFALGLVLMLTLLSSSPIYAYDYVTEEDTDIKIGVLYYKFDDAYITSVRVAFERLAAEHDNVEIMSYNSQNSQDLQLEQIDLLIEEEVDVLLVNIVDTKLAHLAVEKAQAADLPVILFNREPELEAYSSYHKARYVWSNASEAGIIQGNMIADLWLSDPQFDRNGNGLLDYVMLIGDSNNLEATMRTQYSVESVEAAGIEVNLLASEIAEWDYDQAYQAMMDWLENDIDNIDIVFSNNDSMAAGAIAALQDYDFNLGREEASDFIPVFGVDATEAALDLISRGIMSGSVMQDEQAMAEAIFALAYNAGQNRDYLFGTDLTYDASGLAVRIPYHAFLVE